MTVLVLGATGYIGSAVTDALLNAGHRVAGLARTADTAARLDAHGVTPVLGDLRDPASLAAAVTHDVQVVVHAGAPTGDPDVDRAAVQALLASLKGTGRALIYTSGVWVLGPAQSHTRLTEHSPLHPIDLVAWRADIEHDVRAASAEGVRGVVIRPGIVHGRGGGIPAMLVGWAKEDGGGRRVGGPGTRWATVHVDDLGQLYRIATEAPIRGILHGVNEPAVSVDDIVVAADRAAGGPGSLTEWPLGEARHVLGNFADALATDQVVSADFTMARTGWTPRRPGILADLAAAPQ